MFERLGIEPGHRLQELDLERLSRGALARSGVQSKLSKRAECRSSGDGAVDAVGGVPVRWTTSVALA
jgi:hypothetical protein